MFVYVVLGSVKESSVGPTAVMALMTYSYANEGGPAYAALLCFLAGWIELIAGILNLGILFYTIMMMMDACIYRNKFELMTTFERTYEI